MRRILLISAFVLLFLSDCLLLQGKGDSYSTSSVLSSGQWLKIAVTSDGIYRIDYSILKQKGLTNPENPRIFCNNSGQLSFYNDNKSPDDLREIAISLNTGSDGVFNEGDYLLFYGMGTHRWNFDESNRQYYFLRHNYSDTAFYFITSGPVPGRRITNHVEPSGTAAYTASSSDALFSHEAENVNLINSGRDWFETVQVGTGIKFSPGFTSLVTSEKIRFSIRVAATSSTKSTFTLLEGTNIVKEIVMPSVNVFNTTGIQASIVDSVWFLNVSSALPSYEVKYSFNSGARGGWLDYARIQARVRNVFNGKLMTMMDSRSVAAGSVSSFSFESNSENTIVWDVTNPMRIKNVGYSRSGNTLSFKAMTDSLRRYAVFIPSNAIVPEIRGSFIPNQDLHASAPADMIIIAWPGFKKYADQLADIHLDNSGLVSYVVTTSQVYNEFSGGIPDIAALRNFVRMKFQRQKGSTKPLKYLLLFGDGSVENKLPPSTGNPNFVPTYQSKNSNVIVSSFTSDDFYSLLEDGEGEAEGTEDIGVGRLPVNDTVQAGIIISKIKKYLDPANNGSWKNIITLTADDEDGNAHINDAEGLDRVIRQKGPEYNIDKIYLDAFRQVTEVNGQSYPDVTRAINDRINQGCLIFNYTGHGNERFLASEMIINSEDYVSWRNGGKLPLFITATCEFSRFDDVLISPTKSISQITSAGEKILFAPEGGAIALMSTTRVVFSAPNFFLNRNIFDCAFDRDSLGNSMRLGDIIRIAKNKSGSGSNKRNFSLLGDPALKLAYPWHGKVQTDSINHFPVTSRTDSLKALSVITISGHVEDSRGNLLNDFNGIISPVVYDKESRVRTLGNDGSPIMEFGLRNSILFSGQSRANAGKFSFSFIVPRDINYTFGNGKVSYYANDGKRDMNGAFSDIIVGGFSSATTSDISGPSIRLYMNDTLFRDGGITDNNPVLLAILEDAGGINTTGAGIGHDLTGFIDNDRNKSVVLNDNYVNYFNNYRKGRILYNISDLEEGMHTFTIKAWDNYNNSSEESISFFVETGGGIILKNLVNYPNPFNDNTKISGQINKPGEPLEISIVIYTLNGKTIKSIRTSFVSTGYTLPPVEWDGCDNRGNKAGKGMYLYVVTITSGNGETTRASGKMIIL